MGRLSIIAALAFASAASLAVAKPPSPQAVVDRPRLDQKLRRVNDALDALRGRVPEGDKVTQELMQEAKSQLEQARAQLAAERSAEAWLHQQLEMAQGAPKPPDAGVPPVRTRDPWGTDVALEDRGAPAAAPLPGGREPLGEVGLRTIINAMRGQDFRGGKLRILAQAAPAYSFTVAQVIEVLGELVAPADRLEALQLTVPHLADRANAPTLYRACASESERSLVRRHLESELRARRMRPFSTLIAAWLLVGCANGSGAKLPSLAPAPEWVKRPDTCFLTGRVRLDPELRPSQLDDPLAQADCRHLRVRLDTDDGSTRRVEAEGNFGSGFGECHFEFADVPPGQNTLGAEFDLAPELKGRYLFKSDIPFNAVVCGAENATWNQSVDLLITLPEVLGRPGTSSGKSDDGRVR